MEKRMSSSKTLGLASLVLGFMAIVATAQDVPGMKKTGKMIDNPAYQQWSQFKAGTFVTTKLTSTFGEMKTTMETTTTLKEITEQKLVIAMKTAMMVGDQKFEQPVPDQTVDAKVEEMVPTEEAKKDDIKVETSEEEVELLGKKLKCTLTKTTLMMNEQKTVTKVWTCKEVPGSVVKMETTSEGSSTSMIVTAYEIK